MTCPVHTSFRDIDRESQVFAGVYVADGVPVVQGNYVHVFVWPECLSMYFPSVINIMHRVQSAYASIGCPCLVDVALSSRLAQDNGYSTESWFTFETQQRFMKIGRENYLLLHRTGSKRNTLVRM